MSLFSLMGMGDVDEDPIMGSFRQMDNMMNSMFQDPFGMMGGMMGPPRIMHQGRQPVQQPRHTNMMQFGAAPFGGMLGFPTMNRLFGDVSQLAHGGNMHSFSTSTVMSMSTGPDGRPQVYQASSSTRSAPGGIKETKKTVCDSRTGVKKMAIGQHIGERAHIVEREQNVYTGEQEQREDLVNLDEVEAPVFINEWERRTGGIGVGAVTYGRADHGQRHEQLALPSTAPVSPTTTSTLRAKARAAARARRSQLKLSSPSRVEITEVTDDDDNINSNTSAVNDDTANPIIEYPSTSQPRREGRDRDRHYHHARPHIREHNDYEGSRKRDHEDDYEERRRHHKARKPY